MYSNKLFLIEEIAQALAIILENNAFTFDDTY